MSDPAILQPTLEAHRIIVRPIRPEVFAEEHSLACDPNVWEHTSHRIATSSLNSERSSIARYEVAVDSASLIKLPVC